MRDVMLNVGLSELITVTPTGTTANKAALDRMVKPVVEWNRAHPSQPLTVHVRLHVGERAPSYWKTKTDSVVMSDSSGRRLPLSPSGGTKNTALSTTMHGRPWGLFWMLTPSSVQ